MTMIKMSSETLSGVLKFAILSGVKMTVENVKLPDGWSIPIEQVNATTAEVNERVLEMFGVAEGSEDNSQVN